MLRIFLRIFSLASLPILLSPLLTTSGQSETGPDWLTTNCPISSISGDTINVPYQYIEILDPSIGLYRMKYNFSTGAFPQVQKK
jgi:hypothetical protein